MQKDDVVIIGMARTPIANFMGVLKTLSATELGAIAIKAVLNRTKLNPLVVDEVLMGCVLPAGLGQAPARQAAISAGIAYHTPCTTINKVCGSGMKSVLIGYDELHMESANIVIAGGMESMTNAPYLVPKAREGYRLGRGILEDSMMLDGLEDAYDKGKPMGFFAEECAKKWHFTRKEQDQFAMESFDLAKKANLTNQFKNEIVPITIKNRKEEVVIDKDEHPFSVNPERIPSLSPVFVKDGTVTAGNSSSIADGAAALLLMKKSKAIQMGFKPLARIIGHVSFAKAPNEFTTAPIDACYRLLDKIKWDISTVDLFEVNEAFAVVCLALMKTLNISRDKINVNGGACALGHPIGASGTRIIVTLIAALKERKLKRGIATLCIGGGEATAIAIEIED